MWFPFVIAKRHGLGVLRTEEGSPMPIKMTYTTVLFKREKLSEGNKKRSWRLRFLVEFKLFWFYNCGGDSEDKGAGEGWGNPF